MRVFRVTYRCLTVLLFPARHAESKEDSPVCCPRRKRLQGIVRAIFAMDYTVDGLGEEQAPLAQRACENFPSHAMQAPLDNQAVRTVIALAGTGPHRAQRSISTAQDMARTGQEHCQMRWASWAEHYPAQTRTIYASFLEPNARAKYSDQLNRLVSYHPFVDQTDKQFWPCPLEKQ